MTEPIQILLARDPAPPLTPSAVFDAKLTPAIDALTENDSVKIGLHLLNDDLPRAHARAQSREGDPTADLWHAIIHRREGDWSNAKYWLRRAATHPILTEIYGEDPNAPVAFVDRCGAAGNRRDASLETAQRDEMTRLLAWARER